MLNFQNVCFVYKYWPKLEDGYQSGRGIWSDTRPAVLYHVMQKNQWMVYKQLYQKPIKSLGDSSVDVL